MAKTKRAGAKRPQLIVNPPGPPTLPDPSPADPGSSASEASTCYAQAAANYNIDPGFELHGTPQTGDYELWGSVEGAAEFIRSRSGLEEDWVGVRPLGKGGYGITGLWELRGDNGETLKVRIRSYQPVIN